MSWLKLPADDATPEVERATRRYRKAGRAVPAVIAPMKLNPTALTSVLRMNMAVTFGGSALGRRREELIASAVSALNDCFY